MADYDSSLPVRTEADADDRLQSKLVDFTTPTQGMTVDAQGNAHVEVHGDNPSGGDEVLRLSELGSASVDGVYHATDNTDPSNVGMVAATRAASPADSDQVKRLTAITNSTVHALDISLHDEDGAAYSDANPLPVYMAPDPGAEVHDYDTQAALAANASDNHDYLVASGSFELGQVFASASGKLKIEVQSSVDGVAFVTVAVGFNSTATPNIDLTFPIPRILAGAAGARIRVIRTNRDNQAQDVYSTIVGILK